MKHILIWQIKNRSAKEGDFHCTRACVYIFSFSFYLIWCDFCLFFPKKITTKREQFDLNKYIDTHKAQAYIHKIKYGIFAWNSLKK